MLRNLFSLALALTFVILVVLFAYKNLSKPEINRIDLNNSDLKKTELSSNNSASSYSKQEIESIVKDYIINNPEMIIESLESMHKKNVKESSNQANDYLKKNRSEIEEVGNPPIMGNPEGDISIVVFYDYNCSYCKKANIVTNNIIKSDPGVKVILRPVPVLGESSLYAAKAFLALQKISNKDFVSMHNDLLQMDVINSSNIKKLVSNYKIDYSIVDNEINSYAVKQLVAKNYDLARSLRISGAPSYIINGVFVPGFIPEDKFKQIILQLRASGDSVQGKK